MAHKGFVDLQVNGYLGVDFSSPVLELEDIFRVTEELRRAGTVGYCATIISSPPEVYRRNLPLISRAMDDPEVRGRLLGIHLEGPYLSSSDGARGAHQSRWLRSPDPAEFERFQEWSRGRVVILTLAPETPGAIGLIRHVCSSRRTRIALGHHLAPREVILEAVAAGATLVTHLGNGCPSLVHRHDNVILNQLAADSLTAGLITDGNHLPEDFIRVVFRCKGPGRVFVVSDSAPIAGLPPGRYTNMGIEVRLTATGRIEQLDAPYLAGSGCTMAHCMRFLRSLEILDGDELWRVGFENPLKILGLTASDVETGGLPDFEW